MTARAGKDIMTMTRIRTAAALLLLGASVTACNLPGRSHPAFVSNRSLYSENHPVVERTNYVFEVATNGDGVPGAEQQRLVDWFDTVDLRYGDRIAVEDSYGNPSVRADVARVAASYGLLLSDEVPVVPGTAQPGSARVILTRSTASVPGCPNWRQAKLSGNQVSTESNYGCAMNSNLASMIANPEDLVLGQEGAASGDAATASKAIKVYRDAQPTGAGGGLQAASVGGK
jgi:pilus assembly protein CpaD